MAIVSSITDSAKSPLGGNRRRLVDPGFSAEDINPRKEDSLRPKSLDDFIGQSELKKILAISISAALSREEALEHLLLYGPPGLGKTTMALVIAEEFGVKCRITSAPALERPRDIVGLLVNLQPREFIFIDEIHRLTRISEELLYPAMEDRRLDLTVGKGTTSKIRSIDLPPFTLIGATTKPASISSPMRDRFGITQRLDFYNFEDLQRIVQRTASLIDLSITNEASLQIASRCRGTPRLANRLLRRIRDFAIVNFDTKNIDESIVDQALALHRVDKRGLDSTDRSLLKLLANVHGGGPVGLETLAAALGEDPGTLETVVEPFLLQIGFIKRTPRGRVVTLAGKAHLH